MEVVKNYGGRVIGLDLSFSVEQAYANTGENVVQADLLAPPFRNNSFDIIFSLGVLHHTSNTRTAFSKLVPLLKDNGILAVWVYSNDGWRMKIYNRIANTYRTITTRIPQKTLYDLCWVAVPLYYLHRVPLIGNISRIILPTSMDKNPEWRVLDTFDWYSPKYQSKHTYREVESWFQEAGLTDVRRMPFPVSVRGTKSRQ